MHIELEKKLKEYRDLKNFQPSTWISNKCNSFKEYMLQNKLKGAVISVSGGVDSAVTLALLKLSLDDPESPLEKIYAVSQPIHSSDWALGRARELCDKLNVELIVIDQTEIHDQIVKLVSDNVNKLTTDNVNKLTTDNGKEPNMYCTGQLRSYQRTPINYYLAQIMTQDGYPSVVMGTGNKDEDGYLAYFCKAGDGVVDVQLISDLHKNEVFQVGYELKVPESILKAEPSADLWSGQTDEEELGIGYDFIELFTSFETESEMELFKKSLSKDALLEFTNDGEKCKTVHRKNRHKLNFPVNL